MQEVLRLAGIDSIRQMKTGDVTAALAWVRKENLGNFPVVVKHLSSAGTEGVYICETPKQFRDAFNLLKNKPDVFGKINHEVLVQEYLRGTEYVVDSMGQKGNHIITDMWKYHKSPIRRPKGGLSAMYDYDELLDFKGETQEKLITYALKVLRALEIDNGPAHMEIMMTERGPVLIEVGARLMGGGNQAILADAVGASPLDLMLDMYLEPENFERKFKNQVIPFERLKHVWVTQFISPRAGKLTGLPRLPDLEALKNSSLQFFDFKFKVEDEIEQTIDLASSPGLAILMHQDRKKVWQDRWKIRWLEANGMYQIE